MTRVCSDSSECGGRSGVCLEDRRNHNSARLTREQDINRISLIASHMEDANNSPVKLVSLLNLAMSSCRSAVAVALEDFQLGTPLDWLSLVRPLDRLSPASLVCFERAQSVFADGDQR
jgi:hypothetical protein